MSVTLGSYDIHKWNVSTNYWNGVTPWRPYNVHGNAFGFIVLDNLEVYNRLKELPFEIENISQNNSYLWKNKNGTLAVPGPAYDGFSLTNPSRSVPPSQHPPVKAHWDGYSGPDPNVPRSRQIYGFYKIDVNGAEHTFVLFNLSSWYLVPAMGIPPASRSVRIEMPDTVGGVAVTKEIPVTEPPVTEPPAEPVTFTSQENIFDYEIPTGTDDSVLGASFTYNEAVNLSVLGFVSNRKIQNEQRVKTKPRLLLKETNPYVRHSEDKNLTGNRVTITNDNVETFESSKGLTDNYSGNEKLKAARSMVFGSQARADYIPLDLGPFQITLDEKYLNPAGSTEIGIILHDRTSYILRVSSNGTVTGVDAAGFKVIADSERRGRLLGYF